MNLKQTIKPECISIGVSADSKHEALAAVVEAALRSPALSGISPETLMAALDARESLGSTGVGGGIALPHCRLPEVTEFVVGIIILASPVEFDSVDEQPVTLLAFIIAPASKSESHVVLLSQLSQLLVNPDRVKAFCQAVDPVGLYQHVLSFLPGEDTEHQSNWPASFFQIFLADEEILYEILPVFSAVPGCQTLVSEGTRSSAYFRHMPLFASFWTAGGSNEIKVVTAVVPKPMTNEVIRQLDQCTGGLADRKDLLLTVQDLFFCSGNLS